MYNFSSLFKLVSPTKNRPKKSNYFYYLKKNRSKKSKCHFFKKLFSQHFELVRLRLNLTVTLRFK